MIFTPRRTRTPEHPVSGSGRPVAGSGVGTVLLAVVSNIIPPCAKRQRCSNDGSLISGQQRSHIGKSRDEAAAAELSLCVIPAIPV